MNRAIAAAVLLCLSSLSFAQEPPKLDQIRAQQTKLRADIDAGRLALTPRVVMQVRKDQDFIFELLRNKPTLESMNIQERVNFDNALERINAAIVDTRAARDDQEICRYERVTGSKQKQLVCGTQDQRQHARDGARAYLEQPRICAPPCNGR